MFVNEINIGQNTYLVKYNTTEKLGVQEDYI